MKLISVIIYFLYLILIFANDCPPIPTLECCSSTYDSVCLQKHCTQNVLQNCLKNENDLLDDHLNDLKTAPKKAFEEPKCGTLEMNYYPCTNKTAADKLFSYCCELHVPLECHFMCQYETDQSKAKKLLIQMTNSKCSFKHLSTILYCASQNRNNRQCCQDLDLNAPQLMVGSQCLRMCDPYGTAIKEITKEDATCLFNWNVIMFCHHSGIREM